jgi:hypothetical protein
VCTAGAADTPPEAGRQNASGGTSPWSCRDALGAVLCRLGLQEAHRRKQRHTNVSHMIMLYSAMICIAVFTLMLHVRVACETCLRRPIGSFSDHSVARTPQTSLPENALVFLMPTSASRKRTARARLARHSDPEERTKNEERLDEITLSPGALASDWYIVRT